MATIQEIRARAKKISHDPDANGHPGYFLIRPSLKMRCIRSDYINLGRGEFTGCLRVGSIFHADKFCQGAIHFQELNYWWDVLSFEVVN